MRIPVVGATATVAAIAVLTMSAARTDREDAPFRRNEVVRLRAHFDSVLVELRARDVSQLTPQQIRARARLIERLASYRDAGAFPHNHDTPLERVPYFQDEHGTLCAMAHLIASTGRRDLVADVAQRRNNAYVHDLATDPSLAVWLDSVGLTVAEAARIQPTYGGSPVIVATRHHDRRALLSIAFGVPAVVSAIVNWRAPRDKRADGSLVLGVLSGAATVILGGVVLADDPDGTARAIGIADLAVGSAALLSAARRGRRLAPPRPSRPPVVTAESRSTINGVPARHGDHISPAARVQVRF